MHTQERHHRVIRSRVVDRVNTTSLEQGLAEDLVVHSLRDLRAQPLQDGFVGAHPASKAMVRTLVSVLGCSGEDVMTCVTARSGAVTLHRGDVAVYSFDGINMQAGDIVFFASAHEWGESAFISEWHRVPGQPGFWKFEVKDGLVRVPISNLHATATAHIGKLTATLVCPPVLNCL